MDPVIAVQDLKRVYRSRIGFLKGKVKEIQALDGVSFSVSRGELFGLLGPNGAGKTTTLKILTTLLTPTSGRAAVLGRGVVKEAEGIRPR